MLCHWKKLTNKLKQKNSSLQTNNPMPPPAHIDIAKGRASSCTSFQTGSLTVEAAFVVSIFFIAMVLFICLIDLIRIHSSVTLSLNESAKMLGMYGYAAEEYKGDAPIQAVETGACIVYAQARLPTFERVQISLSRSTYEKHIVDLIAKVTYYFPVRFAGIEKTVFYCRARVHAWTGYRKEEDGRFAGSGEMVYITERKTVYHTHGDCSHLQLSVRCDTQNTIKTKRNANGGTYTACSYCKPGREDHLLYYTIYGDRYHSDAGCQALIRTGSLVPLSDVNHLKECSRCAERGS